MTFDAIDPPRRFHVGVDGQIELSDCGRMLLASDEQITFTTPSGSEYDVTRKDWGFYATPSLNNRLTGRGLRAVLVRNLGGRLYLLLVEKGCESAFEQYLAAEGFSLKVWLDSDDAVATACRALEAQQDRCSLCTGKQEQLFVYHEPPKGETRFPAIADNYYREIWQCVCCGHYVSRGRFDPAVIYDGAYVDSTYTGQLADAHARIMALPPEQSDNTGRVEHVSAFMNRWTHDRPHAGAQTLLDVGTGLAVFPARMQQLGWSCTVLDPDERACAHARNALGMDTVCGDFMTYSSDRRYPLVTLNKILEHVADPVAMLARCKDHLADDGIVYLEVPDGEMAALEGNGREEFFVEHLCVFSPTSCALMIRQAGFDLLSLERIREPSTKYTVRAFVTPRRPGA